MNRTRAPGLLGRPLHRRTFLRGAGVAMALPLLDAMLPSFARAQGAPALPRSRFFAFYVPCGIHMASWDPPAEGPDFAMTPILEPLAAWRDRLVVLGGLHNRPARPDGPGDHAAGTGSFLTAAHCYKTEGANISNGQSLDQLIATRVGQGHRFPSLVLGAEGGGNAGGCDSGYSCAYSRNISWIDATTPAAKETNPRAVFNRLFGTTQDGLPPEIVDRKRRYRKSVLDYVLDDARRLHGKLGPTDKRKLDEYMTGIRELERQIDLAEQLACDPGVEPGRVDNFAGTITQMIDLAVTAMQCDLTPVVSFMLGNGGSNRPFPWLGIAEGHHQLSHHQGNPDNHVKLEAINIWEMEQMAYLCRRLSEIEEPGGTALDNTVVFFSSEIEDGNSHSHFDMPILLAGGAGGRLQGNRYVRYPGGNNDGPSVANLFISLARLCGVDDLDTFGDDSTGALDLPFRA